MPQDVQQKWTPMVLAVLSSANADTGVYILALIFISICPLAYALIPPLKPNSIVKTFKDSIKATITYYNEHESLHDDSVSIGRLEEHLTKARMLKLMHVKAYQGLSLMNILSWVRYARDGWDIWVKAREYQREIDALRGEFKILVLQAKTQVSATGGSREVLNGQDGDNASLANRSEGPDSAV